MMKEYITKARRKEKGRSVIEILVLVGTLIVLLIGSLYTYKYFTGTYAFTQNIAKFVSDPQETGVLVISKDNYNKNEGVVNDAVKLIIEQGGGIQVESGSTTSTIVIMEGTGSMSNDYLLFK